MKVDKYRPHHVRRLSGECYDDCPACRLGIEDWIEAEVLAMWDEFSLKLPSDVGDDVRDEFVQMMWKAREL